MEVLRWGYQLPFHRAPTLSKDPIPFPAYCPNSIRGKALEGEVQSLLAKGAIELAPLPSPGFYSQLFVVMKASGAWRLVIDLWILQTSFKMETLQSVLLSVRLGDWMVSLDLKDAYLQVPMHPDSRKFLRFMVGEKVYQFKVLCFGLSTAPQVFTRVMAPVSAILHRMRVWLRRYLDDWLIQASSREQVLLALRTVLQLCRRLGIVINWGKSQMIPSQRMVYLGVILDSISFKASPALERVEKLLSIGDVFLSCVRQPVSSWLELLGVLSSLIQLVPGGRLRMRSLQLALRRQWDQVDQSMLAVWSPEICQDLDWWLVRELLELGISLEQVSPQLELWSDASDVGWGAHLDESITSGLWSPEEVEYSINIRELLAIERALLWFAPHLVGSSVAIFADNSTAIAYLRNQGGTHSILLNSIAQRILRWAEDLPVVISPQFIMGKHNVLADSLSRPNQILGSEWTLKQEVFQDLCRRWPVSIDLFATSQNYRCSIYFSPYHDHSALRTENGCSSSELGWVAGVCLSSLVSNSSSSEKAPLVLWGPANHHSSLLASEAVVSGSSGSGGRRYGSSASVQGPSESASLPSVSSRSVQAVASCLETIQRFTRASGFSKHVAQQVSLARRPSSRAGYQACLSTMV